MTFVKIVNIALTLAAVLGLAGCKYSDALDKREAVVIFKPGATQAQHRLVLASCSDVPDAVAEPMGNGTLVAELANNVRFRIDRISDANLAKLALCFGRFPQFVKSWDIPDTSH